MSLPKFIIVLSLVLFGVIGTIALFKGRSESVSGSENLSQAPVVIDLDHDTQMIEPVSETHLAAVVEEGAKENIVSEIQDKNPNVILPQADRIEELFSKDSKLPIVETITYKSHVPWQKGRPAWLSDYASHYGTSRHFIARSLNGKPDYLNQDLKEGDRFNILRQDKNFQFYLVVDNSRCKMWFYYIDLDDKQKVLLKTYMVGLGRIDSSKSSGLLTPIGKYLLGQKIMTYKPKVMGTYHGQKTEMITVFGTRWIPFEKEIGTCTEPAKGFGVHGTPWKLDSESKLEDVTTSIGKYESDGCIRMRTEDVEELYAIIVTKPTVIEIVKDFSQATFETVKQ